MIPQIRRALLPIVALLLVACGSNQQVAGRSATVESSSVAASASANAAPSPTTGPTPIPTPGPGEFVNPVIGQDFPDPDALKVGDTYYVYATNSAGKNIQEAKSSDLVRWQMLDDALPQLPGWARATFGLTWAPEVTTYDDNKTFMMYFVSRDRASDKQCIGAATSDNPEGPFKPVGDKALICQVDQGGSIDPSSFMDDDGTRYVLWKNDGNCCGFDTYLYIQKVAPDGLTLEGEPTKLIKEDKAWEGRLIEAPTLWKQNGKYYLFYSANDYASANYAIGYAVADNVLGPYTKPQNKPLFATDFKNGAAIGPGGQDIVLDKDGETWMLYHSWGPGIAYRQMQIDELVWEGDRPVVKGPDKGPQPVP